MIKWVLIILDAGQKGGDPLSVLAADIGATSVRVPVPAAQTLPTPTPTMLSDKMVLGLCTQTLLLDTLGREEFGEDIYVELADCLSKSLRRQPNALKVQELSDGNLYLLRNWPRTPVFYEGSLIWRELTYIFNVFYVI